MRKIAEDFDFIETPDKRGMYKYHSGQDRTATESNDTASGMPYIAYIRHKKEYVNIPPQGLLMSEVSDIIKASYQ